MEGDLHTLSGSIEGSHVEDVNALHLSDKFQTLKTGGLLDVRRDGAGLSTRSNEVLFTLDICKVIIKCQHNALFTVGVIADGKSTKSSMTKMQE
jgi:hypothetical protein